MAELKTRLTGQNVDEFLNTVEDVQKRQDSYSIIQLMKEITGAEPEMWGPAIIGFGHHNYRYPDGREIDWPLTAFSPRKQNLTLYILTGFEKQEELLKKAGKVKTGKSCLYIKNLATIDQEALRELIKASVESILLKQ